MKRLSVIVILTIVLSGCSDGGTYDIKTVKNEDSEKQELLKLLQSDDRLTDAVGYIMDGELVAAGKVKTFQRFNKSKIESEIQKKLKKAFPEHDVLFSTDLKIFWEIDELKNDKSEKKMKDRLNKIQSISKEET